MDHEIILICSSPTVDDAARRRVDANPQERGVSLESSSPGLPSPSTFVKAHHVSPTKSTPRLGQGITKLSGDDTANAPQAALENVSLPFPAHAECPSAHTEHIELSQCSPVRVPFSELVANFGYRTVRSPAPLASPNTKQAILKRRRVDSAGSKVDIVEVGVGQLVKATSPKKKAPTITSLATAAYRGTDGENVRKPESADAEALRKTVAAAKRAAKSSTITAKKPRKTAPSRVDKNTADDGTAQKKRRTSKATTSEAKTTEKTGTKPRQRKPRAKTVIFREPDPPPVLQSPEQAADYMLDQEFLFGTSSQLAAPESPTFVRQMQTALRDSEANWSPSRLAARQNALSKYTCQGLWRSAARDMSGGLIRNLTTATKPRKKRAVPAPPAVLLEPTVNKCDSTRTPVADSKHAEQSRPPDLSSDAAGKVSPLKSTNPRSKQLKENEVQTEDISDDETPPTPSPPRQRGKANSVAPPQLRLSPSHLTNADCEAFGELRAKGGTDEEGGQEPLALSTTAFLKESDGQWATVSAVVFKRISQAVRSTAPSTCLDTPTWHEKILLYDPIVIEDFLSWLTGQGVRVPTKRKVKKGKAKATTGRKKKTQKQDDQGMAEALPLPNESAPANFEMIDEPLQPWMVKKWCEDRSICCMFKDGAGFRPPK